MKPIHSDTVGEIKLKIVKELIHGTNRRKTTVREFNADKFQTEYGAYFKKVPFFKVTESAYFYACKAIDEFVLDHYKEGSEERKNYLDNSKNEMPATLVDDLPSYMMVHWDTLLKVNQNKFCTYMELERPIPGFEKLNITLWSGFKIINPFATNMNTYYNVMTVVGPPNQIDKFTNPLRVSL